MAIYMLNLVFDPSNDVEQDNGAFMPYSTTAPSNVLLWSKVWLIPNTGVTNPQIDKSTDWQHYQEDTGLLTLLPNDQVYIRVCSKTPVTGWVGKLTVLIARDARKASKVNGKPLQANASPFPLTPNGTQSLVMYHTPAWEPPSVTGMSWNWNLGNATITTPKPPSPPPNFHDSYSVVTAINAGPGNSGGPTDFFIYSHDPDMDVVC